METTLAGVNEYLFNHIPMTRHLGAKVTAFDDWSVRMTAPLPPNLNHRETAFGGSIASLAILAGWTLCHVRLVSAGWRCRLVIQHTGVDFLLPIDGDFEVTGSCPDTSRWEKLYRGLSRKGRGRIEISAEVRCRGELAATFEGSYVAMLLEREETLRESVSL